MSLYFSRIKLTNWRNFKAADLELTQRLFLVGPNATGKTNFLEVFRFLRDLVTEGGGLGAAVRTKHGIARLRSLYARSNPEIGIRVELSDVASLEPVWRYEIQFAGAGKSGLLKLARERVHRWNSGRWEIVLDRPDAADKADSPRLEQAAISQTSANVQFREVADLFRSVAYLHLVPQLVREGALAPPTGIGVDPYGRDLLERIRATSARRAPRCFASSPAAQGSFSRSTSPKTRTHFAAFLNRAAQVSALS